MGNIKNGAGAFAGMILALIAARIGLSFWWFLCAGVLVPMIGLVAGIPLLARGKSDRMELVDALTAFTLALWLTRIAHYAIFFQ
jgi:hypothetical protein